MSVYNTTLTNHVEKASSFKEALDAIELIATHPEVNWLADVRMHLFLSSTREQALVEVPDSTDLPNLMSLLRRHVENKTQKIITDINLTSHADVVSGFGNPPVNAEHRPAVVEAYRRIYTAMNDIDTIPTKWEQLLREKKVCYDLVQPVYSEVVKALKEEEVFLINEQKKMLAGDLDLLDALLDRIGVLEMKIRQTSRKLRGL
jgi:hypothetical protein